MEAGRSNSISGLGLLCFFAVGSGLLRLDDEAFGAHLRIYSTSPILISYSDPLKFREGFHLGQLRRL